MMKLLLVTLFVFVALCSADEKKEEKKDDEKEKKDSVGTVIGIDLGTTYSW